jgi:hypothetical protein
MMYYQIYLSFNINIMTLRQIERFMEKIIHCGFLFVYAKFHGQFFIKIIIFLALLLIFNLYYKPLQVKSIFQ